MELTKITIEVLPGGFVLTYPKAPFTPSPPQTFSEVFTSQRKLNQKIKEVIAEISLVSPD